jgi:acetyl esterase/lipase
VKEKVHAFLAEHLGSRTNPSAEGGQAVTKQGRTGKAAAAPAASDVEQALVGRRGGTDTGAGRKTIDPAKLPERFKFEAGVGYAGESSAKNQKLDILYFKDSLRRRPAIVMWHGGGFFMGNRSWCHELMAIYAAQGYVTVSADYRLAQEASSPAQLHDAKRAVRWLRANADRYGVDPDRIGCLGGSAGAILSALVAFVDSSAGMEGDGCLAQSSRVQAAVFLSAAYDLRPENLELLEKEKPVQAKFPGGLSLLLERDADKRAALWRQMKSRDDAVVLAADRRAAKEYPDRAAQLSAVAFLSPDDPPFLAVHTEGDQLDVRFAKQFAEVVKAAGRADQVLIMPGDVHGLRQPVAYPEVKRAIDRLFAGHLRHTARRPSSGKP